MEFWEYVLATVVATVAAAGVLTILKAFFELRKKITAQLALGFGIAAVVVMSAVATLGVFLQVNLNQREIDTLKQETESLWSEMAFIRVPKPEEAEGSGRRDLLQAEDLNATADPNIGEVALEAGFLPDPNVQRVEVGGPVDVSGLNLGEGCIGYAAAAPDVRLTWSGMTEELHIFFAGDNSDDTTLLISLPDGRWSCSDDYSPFSLNPSVSLKTPSAGAYNIWVGSYLPGQEVSGELRITELDQDSFWRSADRYIR